MQYYYHKSKFPGGPPSGDTVDGWLLIFRLKASTRSRLASRGCNETIMFFNHIIHADISLCFLPLSGRSPYECLPGNMKIYTEDLAILLCAIK